MIWEFAVLAERAPVRSQAASGSAEEWKSRRCASRGVPPVSPCVLEKISFRRKTDVSGFGLELVVCTYKRSYLSRGSPLNWQNLLRAVTDLGFLPKALKKK